MYEIERSFGINISEKLKDEKNEISKTLIISVNQYNDFVEFKKDFEKEVLPILNRVTESYIQKLPSTLPSSDKTQ